MGMKVNSGHKLIPILMVFISIGSLSTWYVEILLINKCQCMFLFIQCWLSLKLVNKKVSIVHVLYVPF